ncbi:hypothetical protein GPECTOR_7g1195 [Gonium pectorale]|uniref:Uncharacterized protein n=1 Tax=Gonium pectorale TaxID=33097 RepID=A0A150GU03_GONPE|nr:hypothetical protein GPECTOR_7g1195 [Gonium pectorale]|eukprot:KXZ53301.1 hypothetical protein GPECTOR_7g1195 [Gonium pectorale]
MRTGSNCLRDCHSLFWTALVTEKGIADMDISKTKGAARFEPSVSAQQPAVGLNAQGGAAAVGVDATFHLATVADPPETLEAQVSSGLIGDTGMGGTEDPIARSAEARAEAAGRRPVAAYSREGAPDGEQQQHLGEADEDAIAALKREARRVQEAEVEGRRAGGGGGGTSAGRGGGGGSAQAMRDAELAARGKDTAAK